MKLKDPFQSSDFRFRAIFLASLFCTILVVLLVRLWYLQIWQGEEYREFSDKNRFKVQRLAAPRGQIFDRYGNLLADSRPQFNLIYTQGYAKDWRDELKILGDIFQWDEEELSQKRERVEKSARYLPQLLARDIQWDQLAQVESQFLELQGAHIETRSVRDYLYGGAFFHILGYTGEVSRKNLQRLQERHPDRDYRQGDHIGIIGAEAMYESMLRGTDGREFQVVDVRGRPVSRSGLDILGQEENFRVPPKAGDSLQLSLDLELQLEAVRAFEEESGAAVALEPDSGEILAMVSRPALDPNQFSRGFQRPQVHQLRSRKDKPFLDRALGEHYPPGSVMKLVMAAAALEEGLVDEDTTYDCPGSFRHGRGVWRCHRRHGTVHLRDAIKESCDVFFYHLGLKLGLKRLYSWAQNFGFGRRTHLGHEIFFENPLQQLFRFNFEQTGFVPSTKWVKDSGHTSVDAETINSSIGQGGMLTTIMQLARMTSLFSNGGSLFQPQLVRQRVSPTGEVIETYEAQLENQLQLETNTKEKILDGMYAVVNEINGTARGSKIYEFDYGGKTGTSQVAHLSYQEQEEVDRALKHHALFVALAPIEDPQIAVAVIVEHGGSGSRAAAPIAKNMVRNYMHRMQLGADQSSQGGL